MLCSVDLLIFLLIMTGCCSTGVQDENYRCEMSMMINNESASLKILEVHWKDTQRSVYKSSQTSVSTKVSDIAHSWDEDSAAANPALKPVYNNNNNSLSVTGIFNSTADRLHAASCRADALLNASWWRDCGTRFKNSTAESNYEGFDLMWLLSVDLP